MSDDKIYPHGAIFKAAYTFIDRFYIYFFYSDHSLRAAFKPKSKSYDSTDIEGEFHNELLQQMLRIDIFNSTKNIRELILGRALYHACIVDHEASNATDSNDLEYFTTDSSSPNTSNFKEDSEDISSNWFDKKEND
jgi:His-Xaa-Ser system protein HxsD